MFRGPAGDGRLYDIAIAAFAGWSFASGFAGDIPCRNGVRRWLCARESRLAARKPAGQDLVLQDLSWARGAGLPRLFSDAATGRAAAAIPHGPVARVHRATAHQPGHAKR